MAGIPGLSLDLFHFLNYLDSAAIFKSSYCPKYLIVPINCLSCCDVLLEFFFISSHAFLYFWGRHIVMRVLEV